MSTFEYVLKSAAHMERKLAKNRHKGDESGWREMPVAELISRARQELDELESAIDEELPPDLVWREAADVQNFCMMAADTYEQNHPARSPGGVPR